MSGPSQCTASIADGPERPASPQTIASQGLADIEKPPGAAAPTGKKRMQSTQDLHAEFARRVNEIPIHGIGLSVDVYQPDLRSLLAVLEGRQVQPGYLEVFRATATALAAVRTQTSGLLTYHGEGLWLTQPEALDDRVFTHDVAEVVEHLHILHSAWLNHECATKHMAGYSFGTYLPPLYTRTSARVVAENTAFIQERIDRGSHMAGDASSLVLLEMPPLTYFVAGTVPIPTFFRLVTDLIACGLVLDIGHLWTVYRYSGAWRDTMLWQFVADFLDEFPLERVVEIHVAGLATHAASQGDQPAPADGAQQPLPPWIDAHAAPIPSVLFEMLDQVLSHPRLINLKGLALEVDTKPVELIVDEFERFVERYGPVFNGQRTDFAQPLPPTRVVRESVSKELKQQLGTAYERYARIAAGKAQPEGPEWTASSACIDDLQVYQNGYLPGEILHWGGDLEAMFPQTCRRLTDCGIALSTFVSFWFDQPRPLVRAYDFFLLKIDRFIEFVRETLPEVEATALQEAEDLRRAYELCNEPAGAGEERR